MSQRTDKHIKSIQNAIDYIEDNLTENITVSSIAQQTGISNWQFQRIFKSLVGDSIGNYLRLRRLTVSSKKLKETDLRVLDVAIQYQFSSQEAYSRSFKAAFGLTPREFRESPTKVHLQMKPRLSSEALEHICRGLIQHTPEITRIQETRIVGTQMNLLSPLNTNYQQDDTLINHWDKFLKRHHEIASRTGDQFYGLGVSENKDMSEETLLYLAGVSTQKNTDIPKDMVAVDIPANTYAVFTHHGQPDKCQHMINYIYGIWLPNSDYQRSSGYDFEVFDHDYRIDAENPVTKYYLPIQEL